MNATNPPVIATLKWTLALGLLVTLGACGDNQTARADSDGDIAASSLTFHSKTPADEQPASVPMEISAIRCENDADTVKTRIELGEDGHVLVRDDNRLPETAWLIEVDLARLDILGGKRDSIYPERDDATLTLERSGDVTGHYQFQLHGDLKGMYVVEMNIRC